MQQELILRATSRSADNAGGVKGVVYGKEQENLTISADPLTIERLYGTAGHNRVVDLFIDDTKTPIKVLFQDVQFHPLKRHMTHFDLHAMSMKEKIKADVPVHVVGESPAVIAREGIVTTVTDTIEVDATPLNLPEHFEVDISGLKEVNDHILVSELKAPEGVEILTDPELLVIKIDPIVETTEEEPIESESTEEGAEGETKEAASDDTASDDRSSEKAE